MEKNQKVSNFWFGFSLGSLFTVFFIFLFGTNKGRGALKNFLDFSEDIEESLFNLLNDFKNISEGDKKNNSLETKSNLSKIINQIKFLTHPEIKKQTKKFFVKEGKIIEKSP